MKSLFLAALFLIGIGAQAQDWDPTVYKYGEQYPGYVVKDGKKIEGFIKYTNRYAMQNNVEFYGKKGDKKSKVKHATKDLEEYKFADKEYHVIHYSGGLMAKPLRGNLVHKVGCITQYTWYDQAEGHNTMRKAAGESHEDFMARKYPTKVVFSKEGTLDAKAMDGFALKFADKMSEFVSDNETLSAKIAAKEKGYGLLKIYDIIDMYNADCKK